MLFNSNAKGVLLRTAVVVALGTLAVLPALFLR